MFSPEFPSDFQTYSSPNGRLAKKKESPINFSTHSIRMKKILMKNSPTLEKCIENRIDNGEDAKKYKNINTW